MPLISNTEDETASAALTEAVDAVLSFGAAMMRAGNTASRTREWVEVVARKLGCEAVSVALSLDSITLSLRRAGASMTSMREIGPPGINASRIAALEQLAKTAGPGPAARDIAARLAEIESTAPRYSSLQGAAAVGVVSGAFAFLNGAAPAEMIAAAIGGAIGQRLRVFLSRRRLNHHGVAALSSLTASGAYVLADRLMFGLGFGSADYSVAFIASVLFLVPGFPLIAGLFDLVQHQTVAAVSRLAYGVMLLLAVAFGLSIVIETAGMEASRQPPFELAYPLKVLLRAIASFLAASGFAMLFNCPSRTVLAAGLLALVANDLRLILIDHGVMLAPAAFLAALVIGLGALLADERFNIARVAMTVAPTVIMVPGTYAFETIAALNKGQMLDALQASATFWFVVVALAAGLATPLLFSPRRRG
jgi:uncharacterized membrane protein YjjP (DUF1212 family)